MDGNVSPRLGDLSSIIYIYIYILPTFIMYMREVCRSTKSPCHIIICLVIIYPYSISRYEGGREP